MYEYHETKNIINLISQMRKLRIQGNINFFWLCFSSIFQRPVVVAEWLNVCSGTPTWRRSPFLGWTRPTICAPFTPTAASHGSDYSTALPGSARRVFFDYDNLWLGHLCSWEPQSTTFAKRLNLNWRVTNTFWTISTEWLRTINFIFCRIELILRMPFNDFNLSLKP